MATTKKAAETAENTEVSAAETTADTVTIENLSLISSLECMTNCKNSRRVCRQTVRRKNQAGQGTCKAD